MTRPEIMREARAVVQVTFAEYLKIRTPGVPTLVFEGKQCPTFYVGKVTSILGELFVRQLIARGKRNVLDLRDLIKRNTTTTRDLVLFFVDRDFDEHPAPEELSEVYVTRGYSIENEVLKWSIIETFIRANFDIATADDEQALRDIHVEYEKACNIYFDASRKLHKLVFTCRRASVRCIPGDEIGRFFSIDWIATAVTARFKTMEELADLLRVDEDQRTRVINLAGASSQFDSLDQLMRWRGKYHFDFARSFLVRVAAARLEGKQPFVRAARTVVDPGHPGLLGTLAGYVPPPACLVRFLKKWLEAAPLMEMAGG
jgi:hypothetical protein